MTTSETCLHCHEGSKVQVSCDACHAFICVDCHWCHEFQANHEIRVCDRCDSFLCKDCEDMEQCHDCGEVVCKCCGNLLICKFCGSSLCEDCATACAKCGIVLCGRDKKFAVDCDTCKLSYCLVCLASGQKETCIRCHARPSKRMEQLVHLRLKSIYKAFQQSARTNDAHPYLKKATLAAMKSSKEPKVDPLLAKAQADAAAAELLAELEQEESKQAQSKSKKKRKKKRKSGAGDFHHDEQGNYVENDITEDVLLQEMNVKFVQSENPTDGKESTSATAKVERTKKPSSKCEATHDNKISLASQTKTNYEQGHDMETTEKRVGAGEDPILHQPDPMQNELCELVIAEDIKGIEDLLEQWKGVPGKSALRKNAKKALKRLSNTTPKTALKIISTSHKSPTTQETVMEMDPRIVGYVIGKGGQTIRDLMDESGAKIWIDQESMAIHEGRVAYVSGAKKAVNIAVKMIQDLVKEVENPDASKIETHARCATDPPIAQGMSVGEPAEDPAAESDPCKEPLPPDWVREEITCEARFVPLLIGRRGWTIKHIQDASGAKVDIDQTVTPRIIAVAGTVESVQTAKRLVNDVLSYPHAQLKNDGVEDIELFVQDGTHSPPPSSYVMTGDVKSIISASSSLSSTPEPSMASSKGRDFVMPPPGLFDNSNRGSDVPLAQRYSHPVTDHGGERFTHLPPLQNFTQLPSMPNLGHPSPVHPSPVHHLVGNMQQQQQQAMAGPTQHNMMGQMSGMAPPHVQHQQLIHHLHNQPPVQAGMHINPGLMTHQHRMAMQHMAMAQQQQRASFMVHGNPNEASMRGVSGFGCMGSQLSQAPPALEHSQDFPAQLFGAATDTRRSGSLVQPQHPSLLTPSAFTSSKNQNGVALGRIDLQGNRNGLQTPSIIASSVISLDSVTRPAKDLLPGGVPVASANTEEESNLIDSLFAPSGGEDSNLLAGLKRLSVGGSNWDAGSGLPGWVDNQEKSRLPVMQQQAHPNESRFQWGS